MKADSAKAHSSPYAALSEAGTLVSWRNAEAQGNV